MNSFSWYQKLKKPFWAPPSWLFGPVWSVLYLLIFLSFGYVFLMFFKKKLPFAVILPFILNLIFNFSFTYLQFGLKNNFLAAVDIFLVLITLVWSFISIWPHFRWIVFINLPYFFWVLFATILQLTITYLNWYARITSI